MYGTKDDNATQIRRRLDVMIYLLLEGGASPSKTTAAKIFRLLELGLSDSETAAIVGKQPKYVTAVKSQAKARRAPIGTGGRT